MATLAVHEVVDEAVVRRPDERAKAAGRSARAEHRAIPEERTHRRSRQRLRRMA